MLNLKWNADMTEISWEDFKEDDYGIGSEHIINRPGRVGHNYMTVVCIASERISPTRFKFHFRPK